MPPRPPVNPSPHRFLSKQSTQRTTPGEAPRPRPRHQPPTTQQEEDHLQAGPSSSTADQFAATPRFALGGRSRAPVTLSAASLDEEAPPSPTLVQGLRAKKRVEDVEDSSPLPLDHVGVFTQHHHQHRYDDDDDDDDDDDGSDDNNEQMLEILPTTETSVWNLTGDKQDSYPLPFSPPKRRKTHHHDFHDRAPEPPLPPPVPSLQHPSVLPAPDLLRPSTTPRFAPLRPTSPPPHLSSFTTINTNQLAPSHPPTFLRPVTWNNNPTHNSSTDYFLAPLPETFSPHRRRQKFVPGGMAATLQRWVLETGQAALQSRRGGWGIVRGEDFVMRVAVQEVRGVGAGMVVARVVDGEAGGKEMLFAPQGDGVERQAVLKGGCVVGVRAPVWDVQVDGRAVTVGVDWRVLS